MLNLWYNCFLLTPVILRSVEMTFLTKALDSRKRQQLYNFTITIFHYDYKIMKLNCNMKLLVTLFYFIGHHFEERLPPSPFTTVMGTLSLCIPKILLAVISALDPHISWIASFPPLSIIPDSNFYISHKLPGSEMYLRFRVLWCCGIYWRNHTLRWLVGVGCDPL